MTQALLWIPTQWITIKIKEKKIQVQKRKETKTDNIESLTVQESRMMMTTLIGRTKGKSLTKAQKKKVMMEVLQEMKTEKEIQKTKEQQDGNL